MNSEELLALEEKNFDSHMFGAKSRLRAFTNVIWRQKFPDHLTALETFAEAALDGREQFSADQMDYQFAQFVRQYVRYQRYLEKHGEQS